MVRSWCALYILTWKCASRHFRLFFIFHLPSWLRTCRFSEVTFRPSRASNHWKNTVNHNFPTFSRTHLFFSLIFSLLDFSSLTLPTSAFPSLHIVGSLTFKLPSNIHVASVKKDACKCQQSLSKVRLLRGLFCRCLLWSFSFCLFLRRFQGRARARWAWARARARCHLWHVSPVRCHHCHAQRRHLEGFEQVAIWYLCDGRLKKTWETPSLQYLVSRGFKMFHCTT